MNQISSRLLNHLFTSALAAIVVLVQANLANSQDSQWVSVLERVNPKSDGVAGNWTKSSAGLSVEAAQGARIVLPVNLTGEYDLRTSFTRKTGIHSIGIVFVHRGHQVVFEVDAWGSIWQASKTSKGKRFRRMKRVKKTLLWRTVSSID